VFEYVQERETRSRLEPRTVVYVITVGETEPEDCDSITDKGENQVLELARSRVVAGVRIIYSASSKAAQRTREILSGEFDSEVTQKECLSNVKISRTTKSYHSIEDTLRAMWEDQTHAPDNGESISEARKRFGGCMSEIATRHANDSFAVVADPLIVSLFDSLVTGEPALPESWLEMGFAACATYEYSRGWSIVMPPDNSYLSEPACVRDTLPDGFLQ
jgi:broad specificity phosphatase PhoE